MRISITFDPDVALLLRRRLHESQGTSMHDLVNDALRAGLSQPALHFPAPYREHPFPLSLNTALDQMEVEQALRSQGPQRLPADS
jgi:hypothetical protein